MAVQSATGSVSALRPSPPAHPHIAGETCPACGQEIPPERLEEVRGRIAVREYQLGLAITTKLQQQYARDRAQADAKAKADLDLERQQSAEREAAAHQAAQADAASKLAEAEQKGAALLAQLDAKSAEVVQAKEDAAAEAARIRQEVSEVARAALSEQLAKKDQAIAAAQAESAAIQEKLATLTEQQQAKLKEELDAQREILEKAKDDAVNAANANAFEQRQKLQSQVDDLKRTLDRKTADELGEGAEIDLYEALKADFPGDRIERIGKGKAGADIHHVVLHNGRKCGTIIYDSKNHKRFLYEHVTKLAQDQLAAHAEHAILSTHKFPQGTRQLHLQDGVLLANPARVVAVVTLIRQHLLQTHTLRVSNTEREQKTAALYAFITSERCAQLLGRVDALTDELLELQVKERKWHDAAWKTEGQAIRSIQKAKADLVHEISGIIGTAAEESTHQDAVV